jgi:hypothetical protein
MSVALNARSSDLIHHIHLCEGHMPAPPVVDIKLWECTLRHDVRLNGKARFVAHILAERFRDCGGACQMSTEDIASAAGLVSVQPLRDALAMLRLAGWLTSERVSNTQQHGMMHRPLMSDVYGTIQKGDAAARNDAQTS